MADPRIGFSRIAPVRRVARDLSKSLSLIVPWMIRRLPLAAGTMRSYCAHMA